MIKKRGIYVLICCLVVLPTVSCKKKQDKTDGSSNGHSAAETTVAIPDSIKQALDAIKDKSQNDSLNWQKFAKNKILSIAPNLDSDDYKKFQQQLKNLFMPIGIYDESNNNQRRRVLGKEISIRTDTNRLNFKDSAALRAFIVLYNWAQDSITISTSSHNPDYTKKEVDDEISAVKIGLPFPLWLLLLPLAVLLLGTIYLFILIKKLQKRHKMIESESKYMNEKIEWKSNKEDIGKLQNEIVGLKQMITGFTNRLDTLEKVVKQLPTKPVTPADPKKPEPAMLLSTVVRTYFESPQTDVFYSKAPQDSPLTFWVVEQTNENAQEGKFFINEQAVPKMLTDPKMFISQFATIKNLYQVQKPTRIEYITEGKVSKVAEGWKIVEKPQINLL